MTRDELIPVLEVIVDAWHRLKATYRLCGGAASLLAGCDMDTADVDLLFRDRGELDACFDALEHAEVTQAPVHLKSARQYFAEASIAGLSVGLSTVEIDSSVDGIETYGPGPWQHFDTVPVASHTIPAVRQELRLATEIIRGRNDRAEKIADYLRAHEADLQLASVAIEARGLSKTDRDSWLAKLR